MNRNLFYLQMTSSCPLHDSTLLTVTLDTCDRLMVVLSSDKYKNIIIRYFFIILSPVLFYRFVEYLDNIIHFYCINTLEFQMAEKWSSGKTIMFLQQYE